MAERLCYINVICINYLILFYYVGRPDYYILFHLQITSLLNKLLYFVSTCMQT